MKKNENKRQWLWFILFFGVIVLVMFYLMYLIEREKEQFPVHNFILEREDDSEIKLKDIKRDTYKFLSLNSCWRVPFAKEDRRKNKKRFRVVSLNVNWLFLNGGSGMFRCPGLKCPWRTTKDSINHLKEIALLIRKIDPDFVHLSSVEDCSVLNKLVKEIGVEHGLRPYMVAGTDRINGQNVAVLTKIDPVSDLKRNKHKECYQNEQELRPIGLSRNYILRLNLNGHTLLMVGIQLDLLNEKKERESKHSAQINTLAKSIGERTRGESVCVIGELNESRKEAVATLKTLSEALKENLVDLTSDSSTAATTKKNEPKQKGNVLVDSKTKQKVVKAEHLRQYEEHVKEAYLNYLPILIELQLSD